MQEFGSDGNVKILVVDDDPNELRATVIGLRLEGFDAAGASDGVTAQRMLSEGGFRAALIDLMMPEINGLQLARAIRAGFPGVMTILMSAYHLSPAQIERANTGVVGFVPKPFRFEELVRFLKSKLDIDTGVSTQKNASPHAGDHGIVPPFEITTGRASDPPSSPGGAAGGG